MFYDPIPFFGQITGQRILFFKAVMCSFNAMPFYINVKIKKIMTKKPNVPPVANSVTSDFPGDVVVSEWLVFFPRAIFLSGKWTPQFIKPRFGPCPEWTPLQENCLDDHQLSKTHCTFWLLLFCFIACILQCGSVRVQIGLVEYSENKNRTNIANIQGGNERIPNILSLSNCMQDCQWLIFSQKKIVFIVKMT